MKRYLKNIYDKFTFEVELQLFTNKEGKTKDFLKNSLL